MNGKSSRNKTINTTLEQGSALLSLCLKECDLAYTQAPPQDKIIVGDAFSALRKLPKNSYDLIISDPPYNMTKQYNSTTFTKKPARIYEDFTREWLTLIKPLLTCTGSVYVCCDWESSLIIGQVLSELFHVRNRITWQREKGRGSNKNWKNSSEDIWFATNGNEYTFNADAVKLRRKVLAPYKSEGQPKDWSQSENGKFRDTYPSNIWDDITVPFWSMPENTAHPTQKPEKLIAKLILASSNEGDIILDPFAGSGSTCVTAKKLNRHFTGIELDEQFCIWAQERLARADVDKRIQGFENGVFYERNSAPFKN